MSLLKPFFQKKLFLAFSVGLLLSLTVFILSFFLPSLLTSSDYQRTLNSLRNKAQLIRQEFRGILERISYEQAFVQQSPFPQTNEGIFALFKKTGLDQEAEGIAICDSRGELRLWLGNVIDLSARLTPAEKESYFQSREASLILLNKASVFFVSLLKINDNAHLAFFRLLAFSPQFKAPYLEDYQFLKPRLRSNCDIDYWDFREDISGFEKIFSRHKDEYIGEPRRPEEVQSLFFPLRNAKSRIIATVTLSSPSRRVSVAALREDMLCISYVLLVAALTCLAFFLAKLHFLSKKDWALPGISLIATLSALRLFFFPLSQLEKIKNWDAFSPAAAGFFSIGDFTKSPADIFLTLFFGFLILTCMAVFFLRLLHPLKRKPPLFVSLAVTAICTLSAAFLINAFEQILIRIVHNSNINLLHFSPNGSFFLLHLSIIFLAANFLLVIFLVLRLAALYSDRIWLPFIILAISSVGIHLWIQPSAALVIPLLQAILLLTVLWLGFFPSMLLRKRMLFGSLFLSVLVIYVALDHHSDARKKFLTQNFLKTIITTQADWARFFLEESFPQIEKQNRLIVSFLRAPQLDDSLARSLWEKTSPAKFNWYSSLEILNDRGDILSYFSLNIPRIFRPSVDLPYSEKWAISPATTLFLGKEKEYLVGYKDWLEGGAYLGRIIFSLSLDYDMLPFLYSANPYYELLRVNSLPSLNQLDLGFAIFDLNGKLLFNPQRISTGLQFEILALLSSSPQGMWSTFLDKQKKFSCFYFPSNKRIYAFFTPVKSFINYSVEFLKLFFFYFALLSFLTTLVALLLGKGKIKNPLWSFSSRVYASFVAVALIPMFLFTFFTQSFFNRIFAEQFIEKAEVHANFARSVLEDFIFLQQEEPLAWPSPPEDLVLWISSTISNDVNLYQDGRLISSSRREFFDSGLIPELIDGEIYYQIQFENNPFYTQRRKIGSYSYYTLTVPYAFPESLLLISLPFPFEKQEIARASGELMEFFVFISAFFMAIVLVFARGLGTTIVRPIQKLLAGTREAGLGNLEFAIDYKSRDEMKTLIDGFNAMIKNLKRHQQELAEMSKKVAWAEMARKVAHEIKNPLTPIQLSAEHLMKVYEDKKVDFGQALKESISYIISEVENLRKIAQEFLEISREGILHPEILDLREVIQETIQPYERLLSERIAIREIFEGEDFSLRGDKSRIKIALRNLLINAIEAIRGKGRITLRAAPKGKYLVLEIRDTGSGMERAVLERIFEPYFSTKEVGTGLGLPIAKKIIEDHGGTIQISSEPGKGTAVTIVLPLLAQSSLNS